MKAKDLKVCTNCKEVFPVYSRKKFRGVRLTNDVCPSCGEGSIYHTYLSTLLEDERVKSYLEYIASSANAAA